MFYMCTYSTTTFFKIILISIFGIMTDTADNLGVCKVIVPLCVFSRVRNDRLHTRCGGSSP